MNKPGKVLITLSCLALFSCTVVTTPPADGQQNNNQNSGNNSGTSSGQTGTGSNNQGSVNSGIAVTSTQKFATTIKDSDLKTEVTNSGITLKISKKFFKPGEQIEVDFNTTETISTESWVGLIPATIPHGDVEINDQNDIGYKYFTEATSGKMLFTAPDKAGHWDLRINKVTESASTEPGYLSFVVTQAEGLTDSVLTINKAEFKAGEKIKLDFQAPVEVTEKGWIGIIPSNIPHGDEDLNDQNDIAYQYVDGKAVGTMLFDVPAEAGSYDFRLNSDDTNGKELTYVSFKVVN